MFKIGENKDIDEDKAKIIQVILVTVSGIVMGILVLFFSSRGLLYLQRASVLLFNPGAVLGIYVFFGKHVYLKGWPPTKKVRLVWGVISILLLPAMGFLGPLVLRK